MFFFPNSYSVIRTDENCIRKKQNRYEDEIYLSKEGKSSLSNPPVQHTSLSGVQQTLLAILFIWILEYMDFQFIKENIHFSALHLEIKRGSQKHETSYVCKSNGPWTSTEKIRSFVHLNFLKWKYY